MQTCLPAVVAERQPFWPTLVVMEPLSIDGAWTFSPQIHRDERGVFLEAFHGDRFCAATGHRLNVAQVNTSVSARGTLRGIHFVDVPPGQAKYVTCVFGAVLDVVVDVREGSPTFGQWESVRLDDQDRRAVYLAEGLGHAFLALSEQATISYMCSQPYRPQGEHRVDAFDASLGIPWPRDAAFRQSEADAGAPSLSQAQDAGILPRYEDCQALYAHLRRNHR